AGAKAWVTSPSQAVEMGALDPAIFAAAERLEAEGKTVVAVFRQGQPLGLIAMRAQPREDAAAAMQELQEMGVTATMLTGDNPRTAEAIAGTLGMKFRA